MKAIYFGNSSDSILEKYGKDMIEWSTEKLTSKFPNTSLAISEKLLCSPTKVKSKKMPVDFEVHELEVHGQKFRLYSKGESENAVLFSHGWSGSASNFNSYFDEALKAGYSVWAIDHVAHGESPGKYANFFLFVEAVRSSYKYVRSRKSVAGIVGHSMGASAVISAELPTDVKTVLLAPVIPFFENMYDVITAFGVSKKMIDHLITSIESRLAVQRDDINPKKQWTNFLNPRLVFHDVDDKFIPLEKNLKFMENNDNLQLNVTNGLGHFRILKDSAVIFQSLEFMENETD